MVKCTKCNLKLSPNLDFKSKAICKKCNVSFLIKRSEPLFVLCCVASFLISYSLHYFMNVTSYYFMSGFFGICVFISHFISLKFGKVLEKD